MMGLYDMVSGEVECPQCHKRVQAADQVKWTNYPTMEIYTVGKFIDAMDGRYVSGSGMRPCMRDICPKCGSFIEFTALVKGARLVSIDVINS